MPQVKDDLGGMDRMSFVKKHGVSKTVAKQKLATEAKEKTGDSWFVEYQNF